MKKEVPKLTHKQLVEIAYKWLLKNCTTGFAFKELKSMSDEIPDVIGFNSSQSILIECKVSRSDFLQDKKKPHREKGMGNWRFYCCPTGMINKEELPAKWGLIYVNEKGKARIEYDCRYKKVMIQNSNFGRDVPAWWNEQRDGKWDNISKEVPATRRDDGNFFHSDLDAERSIMYTALRRLFIKGYMPAIYDKQYFRGTVNDIIAKNETVYEKEEDQNPMPV